MKNFDENTDYNEYLLDYEKCILYIQLVNYNYYDREIKKYIDDTINKYRYKKEVMNFFVNSSCNAIPQTMSETL